jgi:transposase
MTSGETITISKKEYHQFLEQKSTLMEQQSQIEWLKHQLAELQRLIYGSKRERFITPDPLQNTLFDLPAIEVTVAKKEDISFTRTKPQARDKKHPLRAELPAHLPRKTEIIEPENLPEGSKFIGNEITEILEYDPANIYVRQIIRPKYIIESSDEATRIEIAELPSLPIPKGNAGASMIAQILISKFTDHIPYYRQSKIFKRQNLHIPDSTIGGWANTAIERWLVPVYDVLKSIIVTTDYLQADETPIAVLTEDKPGATHRGYYWVYYDPVKRLVCFDYRKTRGREGPKSFLQDFSGDLQSDGYSAYADLGGPGKIKHLACWAHARRKLEHAKDNDPKRSEEALTMIGMLYNIEREARNKELTYNEIKTLRQEQSVVIIDEIARWLNNQVREVLPKSAIGMAINYTLNLWPRLIRYTEDGRFNIDNNLIENSIRGVALGRKNYLFAGSHESAQRGAVIYSLLATCQIRGVEPFTWLKNSLYTIPDYPENQLEKLLPAK